MIYVLTFAAMGLAGFAIGRKFRVGALVPASLIAIALVAGLAVDGHASVMEGVVLTIGSWFVLQIFYFIAGVEFPVGGKASRGFAHSGLHW